MGVVLDEYVLKLCLVVRCREKNGKERVTFNVEVNKNSSELHLKPQSSFMQIMDMQFSESE